MTIGWNKSVGRFCFKILGVFIKSFNRLEKNASYETAELCDRFFTTHSVCPLSFSYCKHGHNLTFWFEVLLVILICASLEGSHQCHLIHSFHPFALPLHLTPIIQYCPLALGSTQYRPLGWCYKYLWCMSALDGDFLFFKIYISSIQYYACC